MRIAFVLAALLLLTVVACRTQPQGPRPVADAEQAFIEWARENARQLRTLDPKETDDSDLRPIGRAVGDARVVAISESSHNGREFMLLQHRLMRFLVQHHGFNAVAIESGLPESRLIHDYALGATTAPAPWQDGLGLLYSEWQEVRDWIEWLRRHNQDPATPRNVRLYGIAIAGSYRDWRPAFRMVAAYLDQADPEFAARTRGDLMPLLSAFAVQTGRTAHFRYAAALSDAQRSALLAHLADLCNRFRDRRTFYIARTDRESYDWAHQSAVALAQTNEFYALMVRRARRKLAPSREPGSAPHAERDAQATRGYAMAQNLRWVLERNPDTRVILLAHNIHTQDIERGEGDSRELPAGYHLRRMLGREYFSIGTSFNRGRYWRNWQDPARRTAQTIDGAPPGSLGNTLRATGLERFFIDLRSIPPEHPGRRWLEQEIEIRDNRVRLRARADAWDGLIHLDTVSPASEAREGNRRG